MVSKETLLVNSSNVLVFQKEIQGNITSRSGNEISLHISHIIRSTAYSTCNIVIFSCDQLKISNFSTVIMSVFESMILSLYLCVQPSSQVLLQAVLQLEVYNWPSLFSVGKKWKCRKRLCHSVKRWGWELF